MTGMGIGTEKSCNPQVNSSLRSCGKSLCFTLGTPIQALGGTFSGRCFKNRKGMAMIPSSHSRDMRSSSRTNKGPQLSNIHTLIHTLKNSHSQFHTCPHHAVSHLNAFVYLPGRPRAHSSLILRILQTQPRRYCSSLSSVPPLPSW